jgi:type IV secretory pathway VirB4 component
MENEITIIGETTFRNQRRRFGIKLDDRRRHIYVIGKTGMGKTVLLENMAIQDILAGRGVGFIDPHGEAAEEF